MWSEGAFLVTRKDENILIIAEVKCGLGNQLFIYALGYATSRMNHKRLMLDLSSYANNDDNRNYLLDNFNLDPCEIISFKCNNKAERKLMRASLRVKYKFVKEKNAHKYQGHIEIKRKTTYLSGYWQSEKYFKAYSEEIKRQFKPKSISPNIESFMKQIAGKNSVAVHIRRGDYIQIDWTLNMRYYAEAIDFINGIVDQPMFYFFSDDIEWTKEQFGSQDNYEYVKFEGNDIDIDEFISMSKCNHAIIANSTFSWWAAWLNENPEKIIIAPEGRMWTGDFYPDEWVKIAANGERSSHQSSSSG